MAFLLSPIKMIAAGATVAVAGAGTMIGFDLCPCCDSCEEVSVTSDTTVPVAPGAVAMLEPLPEMPAGDYTVDSVHSVALFRVQHAQAGQFWGRFNDVQGTVTYTPSKEQHFSFDIEVDLDIDIWDRLNEIGGNIGSDIDSEIDNDIVRSIDGESGSEM